MNQLERAATALRQRASEPPAVESIERRAGELTRRRRIGWTAVATALVIVAALIGVGTLRARSSDESIVVGPSPDPNGSLTMALRGVSDQATADDLVRIMRDRIERLNREGVGISKDDNDPRVAIDMSEIGVRASPEKLTITGPDAVLARLGLAPALWASGHPSLVIVRSDEGLPSDRVCPEGSSISIGVEPRCYVVGAESIDPRLDARIADTATPVPTSGLLVGWESGEAEDLVRTIADVCSRAAPGDACPTGQVAIRLADGRVGVFTLPSATPPGTPHFLSAASMSFDESFAWAAMLANPLPVGVRIEPPPVPEFVFAATARGVIPAGSMLYTDANVVLAPIPRAFVPRFAVTDPDQLNGRTAVVEIRGQSVIVEEMFE